VVGGDHFRWWGVLLGPEMISRLSGSEKIPDSATLYPPYPGCTRGSRVPKRNREYWVEKVATNRTRDRKSRTVLEAVGWRVHVIWEYEMRDAGTVIRKAVEFLKSE
jgi:hypothetical protein